jgi:immune inhibitor A
VGAGPAPTETCRETGRGRTGNLSRSTARSRWRYLAVVPAGALTVTGLVMGSSGTTSAAPAPASVQLAAQDSSTWLNPVAPKFREPKDTKIRATKKGVKTSLQKAWDYERKNAGGNPKAAKQLADLEQTAIKTGKNPRQIKQTKAGTQTAKLLTILVEFNEAANDDFTGVMVPKTVFQDRTCVAGNIQNGPLHNTIPIPANATYPDNNTFWVPNFSPEHYNKLLYTKEGLTQPVRTDLNNGAGVDISGYTMRNHYLEMSKGAYTVAGSATPWVKVPHSEAWYGSDRCTKDANGNWVAGPPQRQVGHPSNPKGPGQLAIDAAAALPSDFPFADYDIEDQFDRDGDGIVAEKDGYIDHVVLVHAGEDKSGGGGAQGVYAIWAHSSSVAGGASIPGTTVKLDNYIVQPEDSGVGVFSHEYGHDLGLPDLYDTSGAADSDIEFWDLMSSGSHSGPIFQSMPTHMGIWDKWILGWADPLILEPGKAERDVQLGQTSNTPVGTKDGVRVSLPPKVLTLSTPHSGTTSWWSNNDQDWADVRLTRDVAVPTGTDVKFRFWNDYTIEADWDYGFVEVSTDNGTTWTEQKVYNNAGTAVTTPDGYQDPNGRMADYGGKKYGLTADSGGWKQYYVDLAPFSGQNVKLRLRYATDEAFVERGWFVDDISLTNGATVVWSDNTDTNNGWTNTVASFTSTTGAGWKLDPGKSQAAHYYLAEWRNLDGFDKGLQYGYDSTYTPDNPATGGAWRVEKVKYNAPGMLVWYRDTSYANDNHVTSDTFGMPSLGSKGGLLLVDSHFDPMRHTGVAASHYNDGEDGLENFPVRMQTSDVAFTTWGTYGARDCFIDASPSDLYCTSVGDRGAVRAFSDAKGWYPGVEYRPGEGGLFFRDIDASVVIPSKGNQVYSTRIVDKNGNPFTALYGAAIGGGHYAGSGNPGDEGKQLGVSFSINSTGQGNKYATVHVTPVP